MFNKPDMDTMSVVPVVLQMSASEAIALSSLAQTYVAEIGGDLGEYLAGVDIKIDRQVLAQIRNYRTLEE